MKRECYSWCREVARQNGLGMWLAANDGDSDSNRGRGAERKRGVRLGGRDGLPTHRPTLRFGFQISHVARNAAKLCAYLVGAGRPPTSAKKAQ